MPHFCLERVKGGDLHPVRAFLHEQKIYRIAKGFFFHICALLLFIKFEETVEMMSAVFKPGVGNAMS